MPCSSRITNTKMNNANHLGAALAALGYTVEKSENRIIGRDKGSTVDFFRSSENDSFRTYNRNADVLAAVGRKYAETGVRAWAAKRNFSVMDNDGVTMTLKQRGAY